MANWTFASAFASNARTELSATPPKACNQTFTAPTGRQPANGKSESRPKPAARKAGRHMDQQARIKTDA